KVVRRELATVSRNGRQVVQISKESLPLSEAEAWEKSVAALPPQKQVEAVARRLRERNPGFDGKVKPTIQDRVVTGLDFLTDEVEDIAPVRGLKDLRSLNCRGSSPGKGKLSDLTPLRGLLLEVLHCHCTQVTDLSPLRGMPLVDLNFYTNRVADLSPLKGMK